MDTTSSHSTGSGASSGSKVGKLLPKGLTTKRRWRKQPSKESFLSTASSDDNTRALSPHSPLSSASPSQVIDEVGNEATQEDYESENELDRTS
jgi:hypothetical protein